MTNEIVMESMIQNDANAESTALLQMSQHERYLLFLSEVLLTPDDGQQDKAA